MRAIDADAFMIKVYELPVITKVALAELMDAEPTVPDKLLVREWTEKHRMKDHYGEEQEVEVICKLFNRNYKCTERYAIGKTFAGPVYSTDEFLDLQ